MRVGRGTNSEERRDVRSSDAKVVYRFGPGILRTDALEVVGRACVDGGVGNGAAVHSEITSARRCQHIRKSYTLQQLNNVYSSALY